MGKIFVYEGERWGRLVVLEEAAPRVSPSGSSTRVVRCLCDCGKEIAARLPDLRRGHTTSCGCLQLDKVTKHGHSSRSHTSSTYLAWQNMKRRCTDPKNKKYIDYGGRGVTVCTRWLSNFEAFLEDMGEKPNQLTLERADNSGNYEPDNCVWATVSEQNTNRRNHYEVVEDRRKYLE